MSRVLPTPDELRALPVRAIVAFAARCCRRIQPLYDLPHGQPHSRSLDGPLASAEAFARGSGPATMADAARIAEGLAHAARAAHYAAHAWSCIEPWEHRHRDDPAANAAAAYAENEASGYRQQACDEADQAAASIAGGSASADLPALAAQVARTATHVTATHVVMKTRPAVARDFEQLRLLVGNDGPIDPSETGPLGTLWPAGEPAWAVVRN